MLVWVLAHNLSQICASEEEEVTLCNLISYTPNYGKFNLRERANCLAQVKTFGHVTCLRNENNQVKELNF